jgi:hypothetical protein
MSKDLEKLWEMADELCDQSEISRDDAKDEERSWYHEGWADAMRWLMDAIEEELNSGVEEVDGEW